MTMSISPELLYPRPRLAAQRTDRLNNKLGRFMLDGSTAELLSNNDGQVGLLVGRCLKMGDTVRTLRIWTTELSPSPGSSSPIRTSSPTARQTSGGIPRRQTHCAMNPRTDRLMRSLQNVL